MAASKEFLQYVLDQLSDVEGITSRPMMGEYLLYVKGQLFGGIYDDRLLVKPIPAALDYLQPTIFERPYEGSKEMLLVENVDNRAFLTGLINAMYESLPAANPKRHRRKQEEQE